MRSANGDPDAIDAENELPFTHSKLRPGYTVLQNAQQRKENVI